MKNRIPKNAANIISMLLLVFFFLSSSWLVYIFDFSVFINMFLNGCTISVLFKAISFSHVCDNIRTVLKDINRRLTESTNYEEIFQENELSKENFLLILGNQHSPENLINIRHCLYYFLIPTFDFKLHYKKKKSIDKLFLIKRISETIVLWGLFFFMIAHFVVPIIQQSDEIFIKETHFLEKIAFFVRLALSCTASWIVMFIAVFHGFCQSVAEILRYSDRAFYLDWWNSRNLSQYWRTWNLPIHTFFLRHVSNPLTSLGLNRHAINSIVFVISAIFHEYIISLSLKKFCTWTLISFSMQYFYIIFENIYMKYFNLEKSNYGNYMFWGLFCVYGQPTLVLQYYFYIKYGQNFSLWPF
jgi:diacylglycerol O-acyltransferase-1